MCSSTLHIDLSIMQIQGLPCDVLLRVFLKIRIKDIRECRFVCRAWAHIIDGHKVAIWKARCDALKLLPEGSRTVLGYYAGEVRKKIAAAKSEFDVVDFSAIGGYL